MKLPQRITLNLFCNQGLFISWSVVHFQLDINNEDSTNLIISNHSSSAKYQNGWAVQTKKMFVSKGDYIIISASFNSLHIGFLDFTKILYEEWITKQKQKNTKKQKQTKVIAMSYDFRMNTTLRLFVCLLLLLCCRVDAGWYIKCWMKLLICFRTTAVLGMVLTVWDKRHVWLLRCKFVFFFWWTKTKIWNEMWIHHL